MDGLDSKEMHLASKSASSGRHKIHVRFYLKSDRFGYFWASGRFEGIRSDFGTYRAAVASGQRRAARRLGSGSGKLQKTLDFLWFMENCAMEKCKKRVNSLQRGQKQMSPKTNEFGNK